METLRAAAIALVVGCCCAPSAAAPRVLVVDASPLAPAASFPTIDAALRVAAVGDTVLVRPGRHPTPWEITRGIRLVGCEGALLTSTSGVLVVRDLPPGQVFTMRGFRVVHGEDLALWILDSAGTVHLSDLRAGRTDSIPAGHLSVQIRGCRAVTMERVVVDDSPALDCQDSELVAVDCRFVGYARGGFAAPGISASGSQISLAYGLVQGASYGPQSEPGIAARDSTLTLTGELTVRGGASGNTIVRSALELQGSSRVYMDPAVRLDVGASSLPAVVGAQPAHVPMIPALASSGLRSSGQLRLDLFAEPFATSIAFVSLPTPPVWFGDGLVSWLDPRSTYPVGPFATDASRRGVLHFALPPSVVVGNALTFQAAVLASSGVVWSLPTVAIADVSV